MHKDRVLTLSFWNDRSRRPSKPPFRFPSKPFSTKPTPRTIAFNKVFADIPPLLRLEEQSLHRAKAALPRCLGANHGSARATPSPPRRRDRLCPIPQPPPRAQITDKLERYCRIHGPTSWYVVSLLICCQSSTLSFLPNLSSHRETSIDLSNFNRAP